jgi:hypothetical protein
MDYRCKDTISDFFDLLSEFHTRYLDLFERFLIDSLDNPCDSCPQTPLSQPPDPTQHGDF